MAGLRTRVFDQIGVDVDAAIVKEQSEAVLATQHVGHGHAEVGSVCFNAWRSKFARSFLAK